MKRAKEAREAKKNEASEGMQKQIEEANLLGSELKEAQWAAVQKQKEERKKDEEQWGSLDADASRQI
jgi:hypothetical protein